MIAWLLRLFGVGSTQTATSQASRGGSAGTSGRASAGSGPTSRATKSNAKHVDPSEALPPDEFRLARRRVIAYIGRARIPTRQAAAGRQAFIADLSKVYEAIRTSPTEMILERAGDVGNKHEEAFRDSLSHAQGIEPPAECEDVHNALVQWLTNLDSACLALMDARRLKDRSMLGTFRERLGQARRQAAALSVFRNQLFTDYRLRLDPTIKRHKPSEPTTEGAAVEAAPTEAQKPTALASVPVRGRRGARRGRGRLVRREYSPESRLRMPGQERRAS
ncbi:MAG: hypothetical protein EPO26_17960 [Chloroflexota bacterium]|nr:MAG: hypothetical protein EPO26_17960 [Chloroflexota bacterium]